MTDLTWEIVILSKPPLEWGSRLYCPAMACECAVYEVVSPTTFKVIEIKRRQTFFEKIKKLFAPRPVNPNVYGSMHHDRP
jgi:hypothetical protein